MKIGQIKILICGLRCLRNHKTKNKRSKLLISSLPVKIFNFNNKIDNNVVSQELNKIRSELKVKVAKLQDIEYKKPNSGFFLESLGKDELNAMKQCWDPSRTRG